MMMTTTSPTALTMLPPALARHKLLTRVQTDGILADIAAESARLKSMYAGTFVCVRALEAWRDAMHDGDPAAAMRGFVEFRDLDLLGYKPERRSFHDPALASDILHLIEAAINHGRRFGLRREWFVHSTGTRSPTKKLRSRKIMLKRATKARDALAALPLQHRVVEGFAALDDVGGLATESLARIDALKEQIVSHNVRLVLKIARAMAKRVPESAGIETEDLIQEGLIGLGRACMSVRLNRGYAFGTYAGKVVASHVSRFVRKHGSQVRIPDHAISKIAHLRHLVAEAKAAGIDVSDEDLAAKIGVRPDEVRRLRQDASPSRVASLDAPIGADGDDADFATLGDVIIDHDAVDPCDAVLASERRQAVLNFLATLKPREEEILKLRFGIGTGDAQTLEEVGQRYGLTRERIRQIEKQAVHTLRRRMAAEGAEFGF